MAGITVTLAVAGSAFAATAQWKPEQPVELVLGTAPGSGPDRSTAVKADSPIRSGRDLIDRFQKDSAAHSIGIATSLGNANHQSVAPEWQAYAEATYAVSEFTTAAKTRELAERDHASEKAFLTELGLAKR